MTWLLQVYLPSASADGSVDGLSLWTLVPFLNLSLLKRNVAKAKREKQLANRQLKQTANKPVTRLALLIQIAYGQIDSNLSINEPSSYNTPALKVVIWHSSPTSIYVKSICYRTYLIQSCYLCSVYLNSKEIC